MANKPRRPWAAALFTILGTGLGHIYAGRLIRGIVLLAAGGLLPLVIALFLTVIHPNTAYMYFAATVLVAFTLFCIVDSVRIARRGKETYEPRKYNRWYVYIGYIVILQFLWSPALSGFVARHIVQAYKIPTGAMESTILIGDHLLVNKRMYKTRDPERGDIVVFQYPENPEVDYVKRMVGLPGETIEIKGRTVYIDGQALDEGYTQFINPGSVHDHFGPVYIPKKGDSIEWSQSAVKVNGQLLNGTVLESSPMGKETNATSWTVPQDQYFAMGDNRDNSMDSRYWGGVPRDYLIGSPIVVYWSYETPRDDYLRTGVSDSIGQSLDDLLNFFSKTRWSRTFRVLQ